VVMGRFFFFFFFCVDWVGVRAFLFLFWMRDTPAFRNSIHGSWRGWDACGRLNKKV
jgi:hypothetical protein